MTLSNIPNLDSCEKTKAARGELNKLVVIATYIIYIISTFMKICGFKTPPLVGGFDLCDNNYIQQDPVSSEA